MCWPVRALMTVAKKTTPARAELVRRLVDAQAPAGDDEVGLAGQHGGQEVGDLGRVVLAVGVQR